MTTMWTPDAIETIEETINNDEFSSVIGLRVLTVHRDEIAAPVVGDILPRSSRWDDGNPTDDELSGTSAIELWSESRATPVNITKAAKVAADYYGRYVVVIGGSHGGYGEDAGEVVIQDATVLAVFDRGSVTCDGAMWS